MADALLALAGCGLAAGLLLAAAVVGRSKAAAPAAALAAVRDGLRPREAGWTVSVTPSGAFETLADGTLAPRGAPRADAATATLAGCACRCARRGRTHGSGGVV